jgi:hypothetical protein
LNGRERSFLLGKYFPTSQEPNRMNMARGEAEELLVEAERAARLVERRTPKEYVPFFVWGLFHALVVPGFDYVEPEVWGWVTIAVAAGAFVGTCWYFALGSLRVRVRNGHRGGHGRCLRWAVPWWQRWL